MAEFDPDNRLLCVTFSGEMSDTVMQDAFSRVRQFVISEGGCRAIADFSDASLASVSTKLILGLASLPALVPNQYARVIVCPEDVAFGIARMYQMAGGSERTGLHVVRTLGEAYTILGVPEPNYTRHLGPDPSGDA